jgi:cation diffusion facilitator CzcD-associated flavoprotein CzcO
VADRRDLRPKIRFETDVVGARWDEPGTSGQVPVIGTGASAVQRVPESAREGVGGLRAAGRGP